MSPVSLTGMATVGRQAEVAAGVVGTACSFVLCFLVATSENMGIASKNRNEA